MKIRIDPARNGNSLNTAATTRPRSLFATGARRFSGIRRLRRGHRVCLGPEAPARTRDQPLTRPQRQPTKSGRGGPTPPTTTRSSSRSRSAIRRCISRRERKRPTPPSWRSGRSRRSPARCSRAGARASWPISTTSWRTSARHTRARTGARCSTSSHTIRAPRHSAQRHGARTPARSRCRHQSAHPRS